MCHVQMTVEQAQAAGIDVAKQVVYVDVAPMLKGVVDALVAEGAEFSNYDVRTRVQEAMDGAQINRYEVADMIARRVARKGYRYERAVGSAGYKVWRPMPIETPLTDAPQGDIAA